MTSGLGVKSTAALRANGGNQRRPNDGSTCNHHCGTYCAACSLGDVIMVEMLMVTGR
jgi:hypothetical protein